MGRWEDVIFTPHNRDLVESPISPPAPAVFSDLCFLTSPLPFFPHCLFFKTCPSVPRAIQYLPSASTPTQGFSSMPCVSSLAADWPQTCSLPGQIIGRENKIFLSLRFFSRICVKVCRFSTRLFSYVFSIFELESPM